MAALPAPPNPPPVAPPVAPPWFQAATQQLRADLWNDIRADILPDLKRLMNQRRGDGSVVQFEIIPFTTGAQPPNNLPPLHSVNAIEKLDGNQLAAYLTGYGVVPLPMGANPHAMQKDTLKMIVGVSL